MALNIHIQTGYFKHTLLLLFLVYMIFFYLFKTKPDFNIDSNLGSNFVCSPKIVKSDNELFWFLTDNLNVDLLFANQIIQHKTVIPYTLRQSYQLSIYTCLFGHTGHLADSVTYLYNSFTSIFHYFINTFWLGWWLQRKTTTLVVTRKGTMNVRVFPPSFFSQFVISL